MSLCADAQNTLQAWLLRQGSCDSNVLAGCLGRSGRCRGTCRPWPAVLYIPTTLGCHDAVDCGQSWSWSAEPIPVLVCEAYMLLAHMVCPEHKIPDRGAPDSTLDVGSSRQARCIFVTAADMASSRTAEKGPIGADRHRAQYSDSRYRSGLDIRTPGSTSNPPF
jgi:hypothetical protein